MNKDERQRDLAGLRDKLVNTPGFEEFRDTTSRRQAFYRQMAEHSDPMWREMGRQLRDGQIRPWDMLSTPQYREHLQTGMADAVTRFGQLVDAVENRLRAGAEERTEDTGEAPDHEQPPAPSRSQAPVYNFDPDWDA